MKCLSLIKIAEEAAYLAEGKRYALGPITTPRTFKEALRALDDRHRGVYAFVAFHPVADRLVSEYIDLGTLGDDAGPAIVALFLVTPEAPRVPREVHASDLQFGVTLTFEEHPAYDLVRFFFPSESTPRLPGIVFFDRLGAARSAIYVLLDAKSKDQVMKLARKAFEAADRCVGRTPGLDDGRLHLDFDRFAAQLLKASLPYYRQGKKGLRAAAYLTGAWLNKNKSAIAAAIPKVAGLAGKAGGGDAE